MLPALIRRPPAVRRRLPRLVRVLPLVLTLALAPLVGSLGTAAAATTSSTLAPVADAEVNAAAPDHNYGATTTLYTDASPDVRSYLRFNLAGVDGIQHATLRVQAQSASGTGFQVKATNGASWTESAVSYQTAPPLGVLVGSSGPLAAGAWSSVDVTALAAAHGGGTLDLALTSLSSTATRYASREAATGAPQLVLDATTTTTTTTPTATTTPAATSSDWQPSAPIRAAFYYPWFPEAWNQQGFNPFTVYHPSLGWYDSTASNVIATHVAAMRYAGMQAGIASWWGQGSRTDQRLPALLRAVDGQPFRWSVYYELEGTQDPSVAQIQSDLTYLRDHYGNDPSFLRIGGKFVVFVYGGPNDGCAMADRWKQANTVGAYVVLKVFTGFKTCASQPQGWHQYGPALAESNQAPYSFSISPGFWKKGESAPRLARDASRWQQDAKDMAAASVQFQLVTTFNEWGEGTAVESAGEWASPSGYGTYLDALHAATAAAPAPAPAPAPSSGDPVLAAAGDIACDPSDANFNGGAGSGSSCHEKATSDLLVNLNPAAIVTLGDNQYEDNTLAKYQSSFGPSWGRLKSAIHPGIGNHEYLTSGASGYFSYFGAAAGQSGKGYYSFNVGTWHLVELNSNCSQVGGCGVGSPQEQWLKADLAAHPSQCTLAYWHHPRWSSGEHGNFASMDPIWRDLYNAGVEIVLNGHDHDYERFAPQDPNGVADPAHGIREWVIGTGGKNHYGFTFPSGIANSQVRNADTFGVLKLTLHPSSYDFQFLPEPGRTFADSGSGTCH